MSRQAAIPGLRAQGVAVLLAYGAGIRPPHAGAPGVECSGYGDVTVRAVDYLTPGDAREVLSRAAAVCDDAGLVIIENLVPGGRGFVVRRGGAS